MGGFLFFLLTHIVAFLAGAIVVAGSKPLYNRAVRAREKFEDVKEALD